MAEPDSAHPIIPDTPASIVSPGLYARGWSLTTLALLAVLYTLYYAQDFILPIVLALLLALLLSPLVSALRKLRIPHAVGSAIVAFGLTGAVGGALYALSAPAANWIEQAPSLARQLEQKIRPLRETVAEVDKAAEQVERITENGDRTPVVKVQERSLREILLGRAQTMAVAAVMVVFLLYFLLAAGELFVRNVMTALPTWSDKRRAWEIARHVQREISAYLSTFTLINACLATVTALMTYLIGLPNPVLWGVMAGVLNFVPYMGPAVTLSVLSVVSALTFDDLREILLAPVLYLSITSLEGQLITPTILGRRLALNPIMIFLGLLFWGWLWGVVGALLAVPIMVTIKIVCDHIEPLRPIGTVMGR